MVFALQNWTGKHKSIHFVAARYSLETTNSRWVRKATCHVIATLASFHVFVVGLAYDGATKNLCWMKRTLTMKLKDIIPELLHDPESSTEENTALLPTAPPPPAEMQPLDPTAPPSPNDMQPLDPTAPLPPNDMQPLDPTARKFNKDELPFDMPVGYAHPSVEGLKIFALADFSSWH